MGRGKLPLPLLVIKKGFVVRIVPKHHEEKIKHLTNGRCKFAWDNDAKRWLVLERTRRMISNSRDVNAILNFWEPCFMVQSPKFNYMDINDSVYENLWSKNRDIHSRNIVNHLCHDVNYRNEKRKDKRIEDTKENMLKAFRRDFVKGTKVFA